VNEGIAAQPVAGVAQSAARLASPTEADLTAAPAESAGMAKAAAPLAVELRKATVELTAVSAEVRRKADEFYINDPEARKMALDVETVRAEIQKRMAEAPGRREADEALRRCGAELQGVQGRIRELESALHSPAPSGAAPRDPAGIRRQIDGWRAGESEANRNLVKARAAVAALETTTLKEDAEIGRLQNRAKALQASLRERVRAVPEIAALMEQQDRLAAKHAALAKEAGTAMPAGGFKVAQGGATPSGTRGIPAPR
jgi:predicted  nucleic acid-binding Zn-ribbon protein